MSIKGKLNRLEKIELEQLGNISNIDVEERIRLIDLYLTDKPVDPEEWNEEFKKTNNIKGGLTKEEKEVIFNKYLPKE